MKEKRYPFSMKKHGHNIMLAYNHLRILLADDKLDKKGYERFMALQEVYSKANACPVYWATGKEYGILNEASMWAVSFRDYKNAQ